jgi:hypothetical protein
MHAARTGITPLCRQSVARMHGKRRAWAGVAVPGFRVLRAEGACAAEAVEALKYAPLQEEVRRRGRFLAKFHRDVLSTAAAPPDGVFGGVSVDLNGIGACLHALRFPA